MVVLEVKEALVMVEMVVTVVQECLLVWGLVMVVQVVMVVTEVTVV